MKTHFLTFGDARNYGRSLERIALEAESTGFFDRRWICDESDIAELRARHAEFFAASRKGFGYWIWKPHLVGRLLETMDEGDMLLYCDSGCQFNVTPNALRRLQEYVELLAASPYATLSFELGHKERAWTKGDCFEFFGVPVDDSYQLVGGVFLMKKCAAAVALVDRINALVEARQYWLFDDSPSRTPNDESFNEHRHDQSVFSLLRKREGTLILPDETWFKDWQAGVDFPIHALRLR